MSFDSFFMRIEWKCRYILLVLFAALSTVFECILMKWMSKNTQIDECKYCVTDICDFQFAARYGLWFPHCLDQVLSESGLDFISSSKLRTRERFKHVWSFLVFYFAWGKWLFVRLTSASSVCNVLSDKLEIIVRLYAFYKDQSKNVWSNHDTNSAQRDTK